MKCCFMDGYVGAGGSGNSARGKSLFLCWSGPKSITKLDRGLWQDFPLDPPMYGFTGPLSCTRNF